MKTLIGPSPDNWAPALDSLDRTNLSNFFTAWQVVAEMFRNLGLKHRTGGSSPLLG